MCGIGGILRVWPPDQRDLALRTPHAESIPEAWLDILDDAVKHRGPDGQGRFRDRALRADGSIVDVAFIHRRLSIIDHAGGHQPMVLRAPRASGGSRPPPHTPGHLLTPEELTAHNRRILAESHAAPGTEPELALRALSEGNDRIAVVFNGCIYNHRELRAELQRAGHVFSTDHSDTEVLVHGWREWGPELFHHLDGMWSWILWDAASARLLFSRDPAGEKPLYLSPSRHIESGIALLASTAAALIRLRVVLGDQLVAPRTSQLLMWGYEQPAAGESIQSVGPYQTRVFDENSGVFLPDFLVEPAHLDIRQRVQGRVPTSDLIDTLLADSVAARAAADVPVSCFLSGGLDSALIAGYVKRLFGRVATFTVRMPDSRYDESRAAQATAQTLGTDHATLNCVPHPAEDLQRLITQLGAPLGDSSLLPTHWVCRAVSNAGFRVALGGDGGDELFGGYDRYIAAEWLRRFGAVLKHLPRVHEGSQPKAARNRLARLIRAAHSDGYPDLLRIFSVDDSVSAEFESPVTPDLSLYHVPDFEWTSRSDPRVFDFEHYLPFDLCAKVDTAAMSVALETRAPMLSRDLIAVTLGNPISMVMPRNQRKGLLRQVARKYLPPEIVDRPKMGFAIPIGEWFRTDYGGLRMMLLDHLNSTEPFGPPSLGIDLNMKFIRQMLDEHLGTGPSGRVTRDHSQRLYMLLVLSIWAKWLGGLKC